MPPTLTTCPCCHATVPAGAVKCHRCKLEVAKMPGYAAARDAAQKRGVKTTKVQKAGDPWPYTGLVVKLVVVLLVVGGLSWLGWHWFGPKPPRFEKFPTTAQDAAQEFLNDIAGGDATYDKAYFLIADAARSTKEGVDDRGEYVQIFHLLNEYLTDELGPDWIKRTTLAPDPNNPDVIIARVDLETLHIDTAQQSKDAQKPRYGILGIEDVPVDYARALGQQAGIGDLIRQFGGGAAENNLNTIIGASGGPVELRHAPMLVKKMVVLKALRDPHSASGYSVGATDNFRTNGVLDPVAKARLEKIVLDGRYDADVQNWARKVLDGKLDDTDRAALHLE